MNSHSDREVMGKALRMIRDLKDLKQEDLAALAGITRPMLSAYERGRVQPTLESLGKVLASMGSNLADLEQHMTLIRLSQQGKLSQLGALPQQDTQAQQDTQSLQGKPSEDSAPQEGGTEIFQDQLLQAFSAWLDAMRREMQAQSDSENRTMREAV